MNVTETLRLESRVRGAIGQGDLQLENQEFNERFEILTANDRFAYDVLHLRMMEFLMHDRRKFRGFLLERNHIDALDLVRNHCDPDQLIPALDLRCGLLDLVPDFVWS